MDKDVAKAMAKLNRLSKLQRPCLKRRNKQVRTARGNTGMEEHSSLAQQLFSRCTHTFVPSHVSLLKLKVMQVVLPLKQAKSMILKQHYNQHACDLLGITKGDTVQVLLQPSEPPGTWSLGVCTNQLSDRPYEVLVHGKVCRRNSRHTRQVTEPLMQSDVSLVDDE